MNFFNQMQNQETFPVVLLFENFYNLLFFPYLLHQHSRVIEG